MRRAVFEMSRMLSRFVVKGNRSAIFLTKQKRPDNSMSQPLSGYFLNVSINPLINLIMPKMISAHIIVMTSSLFIL